MGVEESEQPASPPPADGDYYRFICQTVAPNAVPILPCVRKKEDADKSDRHSANRLSIDSGISDDEESKGPNSSLEDALKGLEKLKVDDSLPLPQTTHQKFGSLRDKEESGDENEEEERPEEDEEETLETRGPMGVGSRYFAPKYQPYESGGEASRSPPSPLNRSPPQQIQLVSQRRGNGGVVTVNQPPSHEQRLEATSAKPVVSPSTLHLTGGSQVAIQQSVTTAAASAALVFQVPVVTFSQVPVVVEPSAAGESLLSPFSHRREEPEAFSPLSMVSTPGSSSSEEVPSPASDVSSDVSDLELLGLNLDQPPWAFGRDEPIFRMDSPTRDLNATFPEMTDEMFSNLLSSLGQEVSPKEFDHINTEQVFLAPQPVTLPPVERELLLTASPQLSPGGSQPRSRSGSRSRSNSGRSRSNSGRSSCSRSPALEQMGVEEKMASILRQYTPIQPKKESAPSPASEIPRRSAKARIEEQLDMKKKNDAFFHVDMHTMHHYHNVRDFQGDTDFHMTVANQQLEYIYAVVESSLAARPPLSVDVTNYLRQTPLFSAVSLNNPLVVEYLLESKADPGHQANNGETPLHLVARGGDDYLEVAKVLCRFAQPHHFNATTDGYTPLHVAVRNSRVLSCSKIIETFLKAGAKIDGEGAADRKCGKSALQMAVEIGSLQLVAVICTNCLEISQAINHRSYVGDTALHVAARLNSGCTETTQKDIVAILASYGAKSRRNNAGKFPKDLVSPDKPEVKRMLATLK